MFVTIHFIVHLTRTFISLPKNVDLRNLMLGVKLNNIDIACSFLPKSFLHMLKLKVCTAIYETQDLSLLRRPPTDSPFKETLDV